jgi:hypothetical protein
MGANAVFKIPEEKEVKKEKANPQEKSNQAWKAVNFMVGYAKWGSPTQGFFDIYMSVNQNIQDEYRRLGFSKFVGNMLTAPSNQCLEFLNRFTSDPGEELKDMVTLKTYPVLVDAFKKAYNEPFYENIKALDVASAAYLLEGTGLVATFYPLGKGASLALKSTIEEGGIAAKAALKDMAANGLEKAEIKLDKASKRIFGTLRGEAGIIGTLPDDLKLILAKTSDNITVRFDVLLKRPGMDKVRSDVIKLVETTFAEIEQMGVSDGEKKQLEEILVRYMTGTAEIRGVPRIEGFATRAKEFTNVVERLRKDNLYLVGKGHFPPSLAFQNALDMFETESPAWRRNSRKLAQRSLEKTGKDKIILHDHMQGLRETTKNEWKNWLEAGKLYDPKTFGKKNNAFIFKQRQDKALDLLYTMIDETIKEPSDTFAYLYNNSEIKLAVVRRYNFVIEGKPTVVGMHIYFDCTEKGLDIRTAFFSSDLMGIETQKMNRDMILEVEKVLETAVK